MSRLIEADEHGTLVVPPGVVAPGTRFTIEPQGDDLVLRRESTSPVPSSEAEDKIARLRAWIATLPASPAIPLDATRRESLYD